MNLLVIIPARSGSKGIKNKNIINFLGKPLIYHTLKFAKEIKKAEVIVSTDSKKIKKISDKYLKTKSYLRPRHLAKHNTLLSATIYHIVKWYMKKNFLFDYVLILQPTSPFRKKKDFEKMLKELKNNKHKSLCSVVKVKNHPSEYVKKKNGKWNFLIKNNPGLRQKYDSYYFIDGAYYFVDKEYFLKTKKIISNKNCFFPLNYQYGIDIDEPIDLKYSEFLFKYYNGSN